MVIDTASQVISGPWMIIEGIATGRDGIGLYGDGRDDVTASVPCALGAAGTATFPYTTTKALWDYGLIFLKRDERKIRYIIKSGQVG
jgi:hypothetical protein